MRTRLAFVVFFFASALAARAQVLSYVASVPLKSAGWTQAVSLPGFDASYGTLTGVQLVLTANSVQTVRAENLDVGHPAAYNLQTIVEVSAGRTGGPTLLASGPLTLSATGNLAAYDGAADYAGASGFSQTANRNATVMFDAADLATYVGVTSLDFSLAATLTRSLWSITGSASSVTGSPTTAGAQLEIRYAYASPIPEPGASAGVLGLAGLGFIAIRRALARRDAAESLP